MAEQERSNLSSCVVYQRSLSSRPPRRSGHGKEGKTRSRPGVGPKAIVDRRIGGAILDTWYNYSAAGEEAVWPSNQPFQDLDNVLLSAHRSAVTEAMHERRWQFVAANCARVGRDEPAQNIVFHGTGE